MAAAFALVFHFDGIDWYNSLISNWHSHLKLGKCAKIHKTLEKASPNFVIIQMELLWCVRWEVIVVPNSHSNDLTVMKCTQKKWGTENGFMYSNNTVQII